MGRRMRRCIGRSAGSLVRVLVDLHAVDWQAAGLGGPRPSGRLHAAPGQRLDRTLCARPHD